MAGDAVCPKCGGAGWIVTERAGVSANRRTWLLAREYWEKCQNVDGSWGYTIQMPFSTGSMTCAGITSLVIAADTLQSGDARATGDHCECCLPQRHPNAREPDDAETRGDSP